MYLSVVRGVLPRIVATNLVLSAKKISFLERSLYCGHSVKRIDVLAAWALSHCLNWHHSKY